MKQLRWVLLILLTASLAPRLLRPPSDNLTVGGIELGAPRAEIETRLGPPATFETASRTAHYEDTSLAYDARDKVAWVQALTLEREGAVVARAGEQEAAVCRRLGRPEYEDRFRPGGAKIGVYGPVIVWYHQESSQHPWLLSRFELGAISDH